MAKPESETKRCKRWQQQIAAADRVYKKWDSRFKPDTLKDYYLGKQWRFQPEDVQASNYTINLIFPTIETQLPSLLFYRPQVKVEGRAPHTDDQQSDASGRAQLIENTIQTFIDDPKLHFKMHTYLGLRDAEFGYGLCEVGYTADWIDNPNADKPVQKDDGDPMLDDAGVPVMQAPKIPKNETLYVKRIPFATFRCSQSGRNILQTNDWAGYFEWHDVADVKANPEYENTERLRAGGSLSDMPTTTGDDINAPSPHAGMVKIWKIWDLRRKVRHVIADGHDKFLQEAKPSLFFPIAALKFFEIPDEFYPLPPAYNWLSPQDEINETREMQRTHRRRFTRRYTSKVGSFPEGELEKLETGGDGVTAMSNVDNPIIPVPDAPLSGDWNDLAAAKEDFMQITGVSGEARGVPESQTATQANITNVKSQIRESQQRTQVADWLSEICRLMMLSLRAMQLPFWVKINADPFAQDPQAAKDVSKQWQEVTSQELGDLDVDVKVDISSLSPVSEDAQRASWTQVLALLANPTLAMIMSESEPILRKTLGYYGIKSDQEIREIQRVIKLLVQMQMLMAAQAQGGAPMGGGGAAPMAGAPGMPGGLPAAAPGLQ